MLPGNNIQTGFSGSSGTIYSPTPITNNAAALIFLISEAHAKKLTSVAYSLAKSPFVAAGGYDSQLGASASLNNEVFGRLTVFKNFSQDSSLLFDPFFDAQYTNALMPPNNSDFYGANRIDYAKDDKILDVLISKIWLPQKFDMECETIKSTDTLCVVLTPFYRAFQTGGAPRNFGDYMGDDLCRTLSVNGCIGWSS